MPSFKAYLLCGWCDSRGSWVATGMGSELRPYAHEQVCGCERKEGARALSFLLAPKELSSASRGSVCVCELMHWASVLPLHFNSTGKLEKFAKVFLGLKREEREEAMCTGRSLTALRRASQSPEQIPLCNTMTAKGGSGAVTQQDQHLQNSCTKVQKPNGFPKGQSHSRPHTVN